jgi:hypothetical protein
MVKMPFPMHNSFVPKIFPVTPLNPKISTLVPRYRSDSKRSGGRGVETIHVFLSQ